MHNRLCLSRGGEDQIPGCVVQSHEMELHLRWDEGQLLQVYDTSEPEVTMETEVMSAARLLGRCLSMDNVIDVRVYETPLQM